MKKSIIINVIIVILFFLCDTVLNYLSEWADTYNLGAEMALGMLTPILFVTFVLLIFGLMVISVIKCIAKKNAKHLIPTAIFIVGFIAYMLISNSNSFWIRLVNYYIDL